MAPSGYRRNPFSVILFLAVVVVVVVVNKLVEPNTAVFGTRQRCWTISSREILETRVVDYNRSVKSVSMQLGLFALFVGFLLCLLCLGLNAAGAVLFILEKFYDEG